MDTKQIFWPFLAQIAITLVGFLRLGLEKRKALAAGNVDLSKTPLDNDAWPDHVLKVSNNIRNQFQVPLLFYVLCLMFAALGAVDIMVLTLAWAFVASRLVHAWIHMGSNVVPARFAAFAIGFVIVIAMTALAAAALWRATA